MKFAKKILFILILLNITTKLSSQFSTIEIYGSKSNGLGDIVSTMTDINAAYTNIAGLSKINNSCINASFQNRFEIIELKIIAFAYAYKYKNAGTFAITVKDFGIEEYNEFQAGLAYARRLKGNISLGLQFNFFNMSIAEYGNKNAISFNTGIQYELNPSLTFGFLVKNPFPVKFSSSTNLPTIVALGIMYKLNENLLFYSEIEKHIDYDYAYKIALEYSIIKAFTIYSGFTNSPGNYADYSFGFKYDGLNKIIFELSTKYNITLGLSPALGISYHL